MLGPFEGGWVVSLFLLCVCRSGCVGAEPVSLCVCVCVCVCGSVCVGGWVASSLVGLRGWSESVLLLLLLLLLWLLVVPECRCRGGATSETMAKLHVSD